MKLLRHVILGIVVALALARAAPAQVLQTGGIIGKALDNTGLPVPGTTVTLTSPVLILPKTETTDQQGTYTFVSLNPGTYALTFELSGFRKLTRSGIEVLVGKTITVDVTLEVGGVTETVEVLGASPTVDFTATNVATNLGSDQLQGIPTARDVWAILQNMAPQVVLDREDVGGSEGGLQAVFSTHGSSWHQNTYALNGANVTDPAATGATDFYFDYDSFQDVQISTAQHPAEVGTPGVYFNQVTKTGTDRFHGGSAYYYENSNLVANNLTPKLKAQGVKSGSSVNLFSDWTAQLGGPIIKDKLRFFTSWRDWRIHRNVVDFSKSENTDLFSWLFNVTYQINPKNQVTVLATRQTYLKPNRNASALNPPETTWIEDDVFRIYQGHYNSQITNSALFDGRVSYVNIDFPLKLQPGVTKPYTIEDTTGLTSGSAELGFNQYRSRVQVDGSLGWYGRPWFGASHDLKFGYQFFRGFQRTLADAFESVEQHLFQGAPSFVIEWNAPAFNADLFRGSVVFAQDSVKVGDRLVLNLGLRYEHNSGILPAQGSPAGRFFPARSFPEQKVISWNTVAPRLGAVYDVLGNHRVAIKGGYARYYHAISTGFIDGPNQSNLGGRGFAWNDRNGNGHFEPGEEGTLLFSFGGSNTTIDPKLRQPHTDEESAGVEVELPSNIRLSAMYVHRHASDLIAITEVGVPFDTGYTTTTALDPGPDGIAGTADDARVTVFNQKASTLGANRLFETNPPGFTTNFNGLEITLQRRFLKNWQFLTSYSVSKDNLSRSSVTIAQFGGEEEGAGGVGFGAGASPFQSPNALINNTKGPSFFNRTHVLKLDGSYEFPTIGLTIAAVAKIQTGTPYGRILTANNDINGVGFNQGPISFFAEPRDARHFPTIKTMDFRASKYIAANKNRLEVFADFFNLFNVSTVTNVNANGGSDFGKPTGILGPRAFRIGGRWTF